MPSRQYTRSTSALLAFALALAVAAGPIAAQEPVHVPRSVLERYTGEYDQNGSTIKVYVSGDTLIREVPGRRVALLPISETVFRMGPIFTAEFVIDEAGGATQVVSSATIEYRLPRKGSRAPAPPALPGVHVPRSVLERYAGTYEYIAGQMGRTDLRIVICLRGDTLIRVIGEQETVLTPLSETRFGVTGTSLVTEFVVDDAGVTQVLGRGFQQLLARLTSKE